ncbi:MAG: sarcosine oxidase subunit gamma [Alphaproteobacteria bacterium]
MAESGNNLTIFQSALTGVLTEGRFGADGDSDVTLSERRCTLLDLAAGPNVAETVANAARKLGISLPAHALESGSAGNARALWVGPGHWLIKTPIETEQAQRWTKALPDAAINDVTHGRIVLQLSGASAREILAAGCPLDLRPGAFPPGACASTLLENIQVVLDCLEDETFEVIAGRAYARSLWDWITTAASAYGYRVINIEKTR